MSTIELYDRIPCWLWLYEHTPFPASTDPKMLGFNEVVKKQWEGEVRAGVVELELPIELIRAPNVEDFPAAIDFGPYGDCANLK
jgi:hypothetical protein